MSKLGTAVGKETLAYCTSCKMDLGHVIVAMTGDRIVKVQCRTCKKEHSYRGAKGVKDPTKKAASASRSKKEAAPKAQPIELEWQRLMNEHKNASAKPYSPKTKFIIGDKVKHPSFGDGIVMKLLHPNKIEIVFQMDMKVLIHGGA